MSFKVNTPGFLSRSIGKDYPKELHDQAKRRHHCAVSVDGSNEYIRGSLKICLDAQQPRLDIHIGEMRMIFPATRTPIYLVVRGDSKTSDGFIEANQDAAFPDVKGGYTVCLFELKPSSEPVIAAPVAKLAPQDLRKLEDIEEMKFAGRKVFVWFIVPIKALDAVQKMKIHMHKIVNHVRDAFQTAGDQGEFWFAEQNPIPKDAVTARRPKMPWLFDENGNYNTVDTLDPFFLDDRDRRSKLVEASIIERHHMVRMYDILFRPGKDHDATLELAAASQWKIHVWMNNPDQKHASPEGSRANYMIQGLGEGDGLCVASSLADFAILTRAPFTSDWNGKTCKIELALKLNLKSTQAQIQALIDAGKNARISHSTKDEVPKFSLQRMILGHGHELNPRSPLYFEINAKECSDVPADLMMERIEYIFKKFPLDRSQREAVEFALFHAVTGFHMIKGPSGTGKTRTIMVMMLILASLNLRVLVCAGSNTAVDNLLHAFHVALNGDVKLRSWCGVYCRFSSPAYQMATLHRARIQFRLNPCQVPPNPIEQALRECQIEALVVKRAMEICGGNKDAKALLDLLDADRERMLDSEERKALSSTYERIVPHILSNCKVIGTTLNASGEDALRASKFAPFAMLCDEAGQCLESDSMIAMNWYSLRLVSLIGDAAQIPPVVLSSEDNEWGKFLGRSLMARLEWGYPMTTLRTNYRCHPAILEWSANTIHRAAITASPLNSAPDRVGNAWHAFTSALKDFNEQGLVGKRRLMISGPGLAVQPSHSFSWQSDEQIEIVSDLLRALYAHGSPGHKILPEDVIVICPYKAQVKRTIQRLDADGVPYHRCLTVDAAQGSESNVVIFMFTKPANSSVAQVGFVNDYRRLNLALTRAKKLVVMVGNLHVWDWDFIRKAKSGNSRNLAALLEDLHFKKDILLWRGPETVGLGPQPEKAVNPRTTVTSLTSKQFLPKKQALYPVVP